ncbi:MAG: hypothetical protein EOO76_02910 [Novosphingobium sp.]|nr:MAG: hypothetical protein EOO76_02910 [Novosphingobium sp.]
MGRSNESSPPSLDGLEREERIEVMRDWFLANFEDPSQNTPHDSGEGGFQYIWGGPYDASDEIGSAFPDAEEDEIEEAVDLVQEEGTYDWAPVNFGDDEGLDEPDFRLEPLSERLDALAGQLSQIEGHVAELVRIVRDGNGVSPGMGHNRPPELLEDDLDLGEIQESIEDVRAELAKPSREADADPEKLDRAESRFRRFMGWIREQAANAPKNLATGSVTAIGGAVTKYVIDNFDGIVASLQPAISTISAWADVVRMVI